MHETLLSGQGAKGEKREREREREKGAGIKREEDGFAEKQKFGFGILSNVYWIFLSFAFLPSI